MESLTFPDSGVWRMGSKYLYMLQDMYWGQLKLLGVDGHNAGQTAGHDIYSCVKSLRLIKVMKKSLGGKNCKKGTKLFVFVF